MGNIEQRWFVRQVHLTKGALMLVVLCAALSSMLAACGGGSQTAKDSDTNTAAATPNVKTGVKPEPDAEAAVIEMEDPAYGRVVVELYPNLAPKMVERFKTLAREGFYNGTAWHRVEPPAKVIQGGDPNSKDDDPSNDGLGDSQYEDLPAEFSDLPYEAGVVGAARGMSPDSANSQFFITLGRVPRWDGSYTAFGRVIEGLSNAHIISTAPTRPGSTNPDPKIIIKSITLQPRANFK